MEVTGRTKKNYFLRCEENTSNYIALFPYTQFNLKVKIIHFQKHLTVFLR